MLLIEFTITNSFKPEVDNVSQVLTGYASHAISNLVKITAEF